MRGLFGPRAAYVLAPTLRNTRRIPRVGAAGALALDLKQTTQLAKPIP
jgi:hypothetical protein